MSSSAWSPLRHSAYAVLWAATLLSNIGTWTHDVGAGWLMTTLSPSPTMVSLVQAATTLPIFFFSLPAGALADIVDRRRLLILIQSTMATLAAGLGLVTLFGYATAPLLLAFTFSLGTCAALTSPTWQAIVPSLIPRDELASAIALNSVAINLSRAIGPALGGALIVGVGVAWPFLTNAATFVAVISALLWWRPAPAPPRHLPAERFWNALRAGVRYARASPPLRATLIRAIGFFLFASAYWALLPLVTRQHLDGGAQLYGVLVTCIGGGAVTGAVLLPRIRKHITPHVLVAVGTAGTAMTMVTLALVHVPLVAALACLLGGASWISVLSSLNVSAQMSLPDWVRARGLSVYNAVFFGAMALGSVCWGQLAQHYGIPAALVTATCGALIGIVVTWRRRLSGGGELDLSPSAHWPQPVVSADVDADRSPVMVTIEYRIDPARARDFLSAIQELAQARRRDGAFAWGVFQDAAAPDRYLEYFLEDSWLEHLRHHGRVTQADRTIQSRVQSFHIVAAAPLVTHYVAPNLSSTGSNT